jgi:uncharacterized membrane protein YphA (DoxX/SURF4 family)
MHTLSLFPQLLFLGPGLAPLLLRISVAIFLLFTAREMYDKKQKWAFGAYAISGIILLIGLYTQLASIAGLLVIGFQYYTEKENKSLTTNTTFLYSICAVILLSLMFTGPGFFAIDLAL